MSLPFLFTLCERAGAVAEDAIRAWLLDLDQRVTRLETRGEETRLRQSRVSVWVGIVISFVTALVVFVANLLAHVAGWL